MCAYFYVWVHVSLYKIYDTRYNNYHYYCNCECHFTFTQTNDPKLIIIIHIHYYGLVITLGAYAQQPTQGN